MALQQRCERLAAGDEAGGAGDAAGGGGAAGGAGDAAGGGGAGMAMGLMRHCRQCRADAVGLLGDDRGEESAQLPQLDPAEVEYDLAGRREAHARIEVTRAQARRRREVEGITVEPGAEPDGVVLVAVATSGGGVVNQHFGRADEFGVYEAGPGFVRLAGIRSVSRYCHGPGECDDDRPVLDRTVEMLSDCAAVLCSRAGAGPRRALAEAGIGVIEVYEQIEVAVAAAAARLASGDGLANPGLEVTA
jgi:nitrogen fixation protein NifB